MLSVLAMLAAIQLSALAHNKGNSHRAVCADNLRRHHLFVWPACTLLAGLATWRLLVGDVAPGPARVLYPLFAALAAALMLGAGYWGGEMMTAA